MEEVTIFSEVPVGELLCLNQARSFSLHPIFYPRTTFTLPSSSNPDPGSHSGPSPPLPTTVRAFIFISRRIQNILRSSTRVELWGREKRKVQPD